MADEEEPKEGKEAESANTEGAEGEDGEAPKGKSKMMLFIIIGAVVVVLGGGFFAYTMMFSGQDEVMAEGEVVEEAISKTPSVYFDLPEMVVNLSANDKRAQYLKIKIALEASEQTALDALQPVMPRVLDMFQIYLRELRSSDLEGSAGIFRLKEELLRRINLAIHPNRVNRVLFKEIIVQ